MRIRHSLRALVVGGTFFFHFTIWRSENLVLSNELSKGGITRRKELES